jgi:predicted Fe-Mo cluster-binding NifX family protein
MTAPRAVKALITLDLDTVAPRFDLTADVWIGRIEPDGSVREAKTLVLSSASADELCKLALTEKIDVVVCGAVEDKYYEYLQWKDVRVLDSVVGNLDAVIRALARGALEPGAVLAPLPGGE